VSVRYKSVVARGGGAEIIMVCSRFSSTQLVLQIDNSAGIDVIKSRDSRNPNGKIPQNKLCCLRSCQRSCLRNHMVFWPTRQAEARSGAIDLDFGQNVSKGLEAFKCN